MCVMPLFHVHGLVASALATLASGGTVVVPERFNAMGISPLMQAARPTWFSASPTPHSLMLSRVRDNRPPGTERLRFVQSFCIAQGQDGQSARASGQAEGRGDRGVPRGSSICKRSIDRALFCDVARARSEQRDHHAQR